jgi:flagellar motor switch protein FliG
MFVFEDLVNIEETIREIVSRADKKTLTIALKGAVKRFGSACSATCPSAPSI